RQAQRLQQQLWDDLDHRHYSGVKVQRDVARLQGGGAGPIMPIVFTSLLHLNETRPDHRRTVEAADEWTLAGLGKSIYGISQTPQVWLDHQVIEQASGSLNFNWDAIEELFPDGLLDDMFEAYERLLQELANNEESWHQGEHNLVPANQLLQRATINDTQSTISPQLLHTLFAQKAAELPEHLAVISSEMRLTYRQLSNLSEQLAGKLIQSGAKPNQLIAVVMDKGWEQVAAVLGVLHS